MQNQYPPVISETITVNGLTVKFDFYVTKTNDNFIIIPKNNTIKIKGMGETTDLAIKDFHNKLKEYYAIKHISKPKERKEHRTYPTPKK